MKNLSQYDIRKANCELTLGTFKGIPAIEEELIKKSEKEDIEKGSKGSGRYVGVTSSGKTVMTVPDYQYHKKHTDFSSEDHVEAAKMLREKQKKTTSGQNKYDLGDQAASHEMKSRKLAGEAPEKIRNSKEEKPEIKKAFDILKGEENNIQTKNWMSDIVKADEEDIEKGGG